ncbi:hypothetical protein F5Y08DRAFT_330162 [Xylaria arbuscula]|nr:hypothetical protein F5Y08DRAFT_330162 [Xylaria arbuscula]
MAQPRPPSDSVRDIIESAVPGVRIETVSIISTKRLLRAFKVQLAGERTLLLKILPPPSRLLRYEKWMVQSEAAVVKWLSQDPCQQQNSPDLDEKSTGEFPRGVSSTRGRIAQPALASSSSLEDQLRHYLPTLIKHSSTSTEAGSAFCLLEPTPGDPISSLGKPLTPVERRSIDFQKGGLIRRIANVKSPNGRFGQVATVLEESLASKEKQRAPRETKLDFDGSDGWRRTFHLLLEGILRDGEDRAVTMSYELVRTTFRKFAHLLDAITVPRLVVCDADEDDVMLVARSEKAERERKQTRSEPVEESLDIKREPEDSDTEYSPLQHLDPRALEITGLQDWSNCIFGDPLFATVFSHTTPEFDRGFRHAHEADRTKQSDEQQQVKKEREDPKHAKTRILLYECYHATVAIVKQFYRPEPDSSEREIAARRRLVAALAKLERIEAHDSEEEEEEEGAGKRHRRPSHPGPYDWPVKRPRGDTPVS